MADVKFIVGGYTFTFQNGDVKSVKSDVSSKSEQQEISQTGPMGAYLYDYDGVTKTVTISGTLTEASTTRISGYSITTIFQQKQWLESIANGSQVGIEIESTYESQSILSSGSPTPPFLGGFTSTYCMVQSMSFVEKGGNPNELDFTIVLMVGQQT